MSFLELGLKINFQIGVLGIELRPTGRALSALNYYTASPPLSYIGF